jgi:putative redox protein
MTHIVGVLLVLRRTFKEYFHMNPSMKITYTGDLHCEALHMKSNTVIATDAPVDNKGKGEAFSPTDLTCVSLATCIITTMAISAEAKSIAFGKVEAEIQKVMGDKPRTIAEIIIELKVSGVEWTEKEKTIMENIAHTCPVSRSLHPSVKQTVTFNYF